mmetsp:Transcript_38494/g.58349  ORF Transcript_38494/g.58349 Transcript_38494/m.58349 type:complete len:180 (-) Transcript_38494:28-567(-)
MKYHTANVLSVMITNASKVAYESYSHMEKRKCHRYELSEMEECRGSCNGLLNIYAKINLKKRRKYAHNLTAKETFAMINGDYLEINLPCGKRMYIPKSEKGKVYSQYKFWTISTKKVNRSVARLVKFLVESKIMPCKLRNTEISLKSFKTEKKQSIFVFHFGNLISDVFSVYSFRQYWK